VRLFIAVDLDDAVREACRRISRGIDKRIRPIASGCDLKWVAPENLHITVRFIGHVSDEIAAGITGVFVAPIPQPGFEAALDRPSVFPPAGAPRVIWVGLAEGSEQLRLVHDEVERRLQTIAVPAEDRAFTAHLTLARFRAPVGGAGAAIRRALGDVPVAAIRWPVRRVTLYESRLSPKGPTYRPLVYAPLVSAHTGRG